MLTACQQSGCGFRASVLGQVVRTPLGWTAGTGMETLTYPAYRTRYPESLGDQYPRRQDAPASQFLRNMIHRRVELHKAGKTSVGVRTQFSGLHDLLSGVTLGRTSLSGPNSALNQAIKRRVGRPRNHMCKFQRLFEHGLGVARTGIGGMQRAPGR